MKKAPLISATNGSPRNTIFLLRHGAIKSPGSSKRYYIGQQDLPLRDIGVAQARAWADYFADAALDEICCSDLTRCLQTAQIIGALCSLAPRANPELREISLGAWEGQGFDTINTLYPQAFEQRGEFIADHRPPGGESFRDLQHRVWPIFETLARRHQRKTLIVTHAGVIRVLLCRLLGMPLENLFAIGQSHGGLTIIDVQPWGYCLRALNRRLPP
ncbi:MAG: histidine phosphatase family protein [Desulfobacterales bacterium]|jgi:probable phosphoglycerate mutase|nr:histidine phosphatase family protein [Desulfobacterales bacterium]